MAGKAWAVLTQSPPPPLAHQGWEGELPGTLGYPTCFTFASQHGLGLGTRTGPWTLQKAGRWARSAGGVSQRFTWKRETLSACLPGLSSMSGR